MSCTLFYKKLHYKRLENKKEWKTNSRPFLFYIKQPNSHKQRLAIGFVFKFGKGKIATNAKTLQHKCQQGIQPKFHKLYFPKSY